MIYLTLLSWYLTGVASCAYMIYVAYRIDGRDVILSDIWYLTGVAWFGPLLLIFMIVYLLVENSNEVIIRSPYKKDPK